MKKLNRWMMVAILFCGLGATLTSCSVSDNPTSSTPDPSTPPSTPPSVVDYTVMLYCTGGEDLDYQTENDFIAACKGLAGNGSRVRFFLQYKYSSQKGLDKQSAEYAALTGQKYDWIGGKPGGLYRLELTSRMYKKNGSISKFTDANLYGNQQEKSQMYQPDSIASFIKYCATVAPAKNYVFMVGDHGSGYNVYFDFSKNANTQASAAERRAVCSDAFNNNNNITIKELREGIEKSGVHLKLFNFDDCLMNCTEVAAEFTDVSDYMLAANHVTTGGNYDQFIGHLAKAGITGDFEGEMKKYVDKFIAGYNNLSEEPEVLKKYPNAKQHCAYAFTDLKKFKGVIPALKAFVDKLLSEAKSGKLTADQQKFAATECYQPKVGYAFYDLLGYAYALQKQDANLATEYEALKAAVETAMLKQSYSQALKNYLENADFKQLSYNINVGATVEDESASMSGTILRVDNEDGQVFCLDEFGNIWWYTPKTGKFTFQTKNPQKHLAWANGYGLSTLVQQTGWDKWIRQNAGFPTKNPPYYFE